MSAGRLGRRFAFDTHCKKRPMLTGTVVAALTLPPGGESYLMLYPVSVSEYDQESREAFRETVLPHLVRWLQQKQVVETGPSSHQQLIVEWKAGEHHFHEVSFLLAAT
jgi:hypothetical protein